MAGYLRNDFSRGWVPNADAVNAPKNALLRMDNLILDERGILSLRKGSAVLYRGLGGPINGLYSTTLGGSKHRLCGAGNGLYDNGASLGQSLAGTGDVSFGSHLGQVFCARSSSRLKYDGATLRNWGIDAPNIPLEVSPYNIGSKTIGTFDTDDQALWTAYEGTKASETGIYDEALELTSSVDYRGLIMKEFSPDEDFTVYDDGHPGSEEDEVQFYFYTMDAPDMRYMALQINIATSPPNWYRYVWDWVVNPKPANGWTKMSVKRKDFARWGNTPGRDWSTVVSVQMFLECSSGNIPVRFDDLRIPGAGVETLSGKYQLAYCLVRSEGDYQILSGPSPFASEIDLSSEGYAATLPSAVTDSMDSQVTEVWLYRLGGMLDNAYWVASATAGWGEPGDHTGDFEEEYLTAPANAFTCTYPEERAYDDTHSTYGVYNRTAPWEGEYLPAIVFGMGLSDVQALALNRTLEVDNERPPVNIIGIDGPHYDRLFALTATMLYPSRRLNPDSYSVDQQIRICGKDEVAYWIKRTAQALYIGTSKDIYRIEGDGAELPDGTVNFAKIPLNIGTPPAFKAVASEGNFIVYLASDGWRMFNGFTSELVPNEDVDLLYRGYTRHGVLPVNISDPASRFRATIAKGVLSAICPESYEVSGLWGIPRDLSDIDGSSVTGTWGIPRTIPALPPQGDLWGIPRLESEMRYAGVAHRYHFASGKWYRHVYGAKFTEIFREEDGMLIAGDYDGNIRRLDIGSTDDGDNIPLRVVTPYDDNGQSANRKDAFDFAMRCDLGAGSAAVEFRIDNLAAASKTITGVTQPGPGVYRTPINDLPVFMQLGLTITGDFSTFRLYDWQAGYRERPVLQYYFDNRPLLPSLRRRRFGGLTADIEVVSGSPVLMPVLDGVNLTSQNLTMASPRVMILSFSSAVGQDLWAVVSGGTFENYGITPIILEELPQQFQGLFTAKNAAWAGEKVMSGIRIRVCTLGVERAFRIYLDGMPYPTPYRLTTHANEPSTEIFNFASVQTATEIAFEVDGKIELYDWEPIVLYSHPMARLVWDTGPIDLGTGRLTWIRQIDIKIKTPVNFVILPYFDDTAFPSKTVTVGSLADKTTVFTTKLDREYKGRQPRIVISASSEFNPHWIRLWRKQTGNETEKKPVEVKA